MSVDIAGYEKLLEEARQRARAGGKEETSSLTQLPPAALAQLAEANVPHTDDSAKFSHEPLEAQLLAIWNGDDLGLSPAEAVEDEALAILLDRTNFYAEMGGQVGDSGVLVGKTGIFDVETTRQVAGYVLHIGRVRQGKLRVSDRVTATVSPQRVHTEQSHTATHLANWALREVLGEGVQQKGSLVDPEKLRFDFSHPRALADEELAQVELLVQKSIDRQLPVYIEEVPQEQALKIAGLRAVFGEKYPPKVRVVSVGVPVEQLLADPANETWRQYSIEFCGGTHLRGSGEAEAFVITSEESVSKGIRRLVALTGEGARQAQQLAGTLDTLLERARSLPEQDLPGAIQLIQQQLALPGLPLRDKRRGQVQIGELQARYKAWEKSSKATGDGGGTFDSSAVASRLLEQAAPLAGGKLIVAEIPGASDEQLRSTIDSLKKRSPSYAILLASASETKVTFVAAVSDDLIGQGLKAGDWIRETAKAAGGSGGGRPQMAQAGAKDPGKLPEALAAALGFVQKIAS
jgi:alanyl-tRNA synthetase